MPPVLILMLMAVVFTGAIALFQGAYWAYIARQEQEKKELARRLGMMGDEGGGPGSGALFRDRAADAAAQALGSFGEHLDMTIAAADIDLSVSQLLTRCAIAGAVGFLTGSILISLTLGLVIGGVLSVVPYVLVRRQGAARAKKLVEQLPDALDLISRSLQAGVGLNDTFRTVAEEMEFPIAAEFGRVFEEVRFGREFRHAAENMIERNPTVFDLRLMVSSTLLARETGGNLIEILANISETIRGRFLFQAKVKAMTSEARTSAMVLGSLPLGVAVLVNLLSPGYMDPLFEDQLGNYLLGGALTWYSIGAFMMNQMSQVEV